MKSYPRIKTVGDSALVVEFGEIIDLSVNYQVYGLAEAIEVARVRGITGLIPTYRSLLIEYDALMVSFQEITMVVEKVLHQVTEPANVIDEQGGELLEIPVVYGGKSGPDLVNVAEYAGISTEEVIEIHTSLVYRVYMLGFLPGFAYLGGMDNRIACPRLETPRIRVPAGSVGIAESQTGIYPVESPGGWQLIGYTPVPLFNHASEPPVALHAGGFVRFVSTGLEKIKRIETAISEGSYSPSTMKNLL